MSDSKQEKNIQLDSEKLIVNTAQHMLKFNEKTGKAVIPSHLSDPARLGTAESKTGKSLVDGNPVAIQSTVLAPDTNADSDARVFAPTLGDSESINRQFEPVAEGIHDKWTGEPASKLTTGSLLNIEEGSAQSELKHAGTHQFAALSNLAPDPGERAAAANRIVPVPYDGAQENIILASNEKLAPNTIAIDSEPSLAGNPVIAHPAADGRAPGVTVTSPLSPETTAQAGLPRLSAELARAADEASGSAPAQGMQNVAAVSAVSQVRSGSTKVSLNAATLERLRDAETATLELNKQIDALSARVALKQK